MIIDFLIEYALQVGVGLLISYFAYIVLFRRGHNPFRDRFLPSYDYIIIGGGSAGCILANRLTEDPDVTVLLLEAGGKYNNFLAKIPAACPLLQVDSGIDWNYKVRIYRWPRSYSFF